MKRQYSLIPEQTRIDRLRRRMARFVFCADREQRPYVVEKYANLLKKARTKYTTSNGLPLQRSYNDFVFVGTRGDSAVYRQGGVDEGQALPVWDSIDNEFDFS